MEYAKSQFSATIPPYIRDLVFATTLQI